MAMSPERGFLGAPEYTEVPDFCGRCHVGVAKEYKAGAHGKAINDGGAQCVICHGNHAVQRANLSLINEETCTRCHSYERAALIKMSLVETDTMINATEGDLERLYRLGFAVVICRAAFSINATVSTASFMVLTWNVSAAKLQECKANWAK